jgi:hypothetical protein
VSASLKQIPVSLPTDTEDVYHLSYLRQLEIKIKRKISKMTGDLFGSCTTKDGLAKALLPKLA